jgi:uncharacterized protein YqgC (DUF456 family)
MLATLGIVVMALALILTPVGVPGLWIMVAVLAIGAWFGEVAVLVLVTCVVLALIAELLEYVIVSRLNLRYGGSRRAFWGAIVGGIVGVMLGAQLPLIGSIVGGVVGSFAGAALATLYETRQFDKTLRVGWGVLLGRMWAAATKVAAGVLIFVLGAASLLR